eukprot:gnl/MRDRNA2_/MRDRNA2_17361_c0_seq1.p1 gnl/MRDRNA2_/MRDRNA2_17361_c0~~gnl/MRDRNA2_/MRDRNA2_17361_c0_seq1.p1  ORF type:complete len:290 (-),score=71.54 gnl/MRDRNA2_/MRDRNA2_17361_c0_seq1:183-956(-)
MDLIDAFLVGVVLCSLSLLASVILSASLAQRDCKEALENESGLEEPVSPPLQSGSRTSVSIMIAVTAILQYAAVSASSTEVLAVTHWHVTGTDLDSKTAEDMVSLFTYVVRAILGILLGFAMDKELTKRGKMVLIIFVAFVDAIVFTLFAFKKGHPLPLWIVLQTSTNVLQTAAFAMLAMLHKGNVGTVYGVFTASMEGASSAASLLQGVIVDADNGGFQAAFLVHAVTLLVGFGVSVAALRCISRNKDLKLIMQGK